MNSMVVSLSCRALGWCLGAVTLVQAQGTFLCGNARLRDAWITDCAGTPIGGTNFVVEVRAENPQTHQFDGHLEYLAGGESKPLGMVPILGGKHAGLFSVGTVRIPFVAPGQEASVEFRAWDRTTGPTFETAKRRGSVVTKVRLGGVGQPPTMPSPMTKFVGLKVCPVP